jgi:hypothetical protein
MPVVDHEFVVFWSPFRRLGPCTNQCYACWSEASAVARRPAERSDLKDSERLPTGQVQHAVTAAGFPESIVDGGAEPERSVLHEGVPRRVIVANDHKASEPIEGSPDGGIRVTLAPADEASAQPTFKLTKVEAK